MSAAAFPYDVCLSHRAKEETAVRLPSLSASNGERGGVRCRSLPLAERLQQDGLKVGFDEWVLKPGDSIPAKIEAGLEHSRAVPLAHRMGEGSGVRVAHAFGSDWAPLLTLSQPSTLNPRPTAAPLNQERRFLPLRLSDAVNFRRRSGPKRALPPR